MSWPTLPARFTAEGGYRFALIDAPALIADIEATVPAAAREETFYYFTRSPFPLSEFVAADPQRQTFGLWRGGEAVACSSIYDADAAAQRVTMGFTWVAPQWRGRGVNTVLKQGLFRELAAAGVREVWLRADVDNARSCAAMEKMGAQRMFVDEAPRVYPDRVSQSVFYRKTLCKFS
ncbi:GNAT family N-acetyltransferase [Corynebacterium uberis]|uniref:GNAT family N-acetyltransferase n=1 Tax=Corynebacterium TaxID=1716 RepID=UPI001D0A118A|nr:MULTISPECIES: GNAT family N-acetyltransferase [Corynebacterium]MCZ9309690.1 GNAT family N-acetyltransferase [Corynebacterium sp. c6VSa_13]UDL73494.1 GNAT family N-acetyltransferase [Corynebacterium uberis]UDL75626.1 GNAT family N-acetyltransferase [Corynebacterium uberis]UDL77839.1 GNAT family N-acetyltransferase [Corynebacterium uberis]UDL80122.1 GNAT family N-acetyltransferase [Corynebacterium uberis]